MATPVKLPELGESVTEGTVTRWLKQVGESVEVDEPLLEVSTDKVDTEIPSPVAGTLLEIRVEEDETVEVGAELAIVGSSDEAGSAADAEAPDTETSATQAQDKDGADAEAPLVRVVQPNVPQAEKWDPDVREWAKLSKAAVRKLPEAVREAGAVAAG